MIDLHCHALPGIDDGPDEMGDAVALARAAAESGTHTLVATPHIDHWWDVDPATVPDRVAEVRAVLASEGVDVELLTGGEIALTRLVDLDEPELDALALGSGRHILLEAPLSPGAGDFEALVLAVHTRGRPVLLAHPERCPAFLRSPERLEPLLDAGVLTQVTAGSLIGQFGRTIEEKSLQWVERGWVHVLASDAHDAYRRPPGLREPAERAGLEPELIDWLTEAVPRAIVEGAPIPERPATDGAGPPTKRKWFRPRA
jgi:protein-tyrosine phosphatase